MTTPREAFQPFAELEARFGLDDSPLLVLMRALVETTEEQADTLDKLIREQLRMNEWMLQHRQGGQS